MKRRLVSFCFITLLFIAVLLCFTLPAMAASEPALNKFDLSEGDITVSTGTGADTVKVSYGGALLKDNIPKTENITITGTDTEKKTFVSADSAHITLDGASIRNATAGLCAFELAGNANVSLTLVGTNVLQSGGWKAGLQVPDGAAVVIQGEGSLTATGGSEAAGIGGAHDAPCGTVTIQQGEVTAIGGDGGGAGIGGGWRGTGGTVTITGGTVNATGGNSGAGIGGGSYRSTGVTMITGGEVTANGGSYSAGIGGGRDAPGGTTVIQNGEITANGGSGSAGIGGGKQCAGGTISITGGMVNATGGSCGAGIGGGGAPYGALGGAGGTITITGGNIVATGKDGGAGIGGGEGGAGGTITIDATATVKAASYSVQRPAVYTASGALEAGSTARVLVSNFSVLQNANATTGIYSTAGSSMGIDFAPAAGYRSIAFTVPDNTYHLKTNGIYQTHSTGPAVSLDFNVASAGLISFNDVMDAVFDITYHLNSGTNHPANVPTYAYGTGLTLQPPDRDHYVFDGWYDNPDFSGVAVIEITAAESGSKVLYAKWLPTYTIAPISDQSMAALTVGYRSGAREVKEIMIERTGSGDLTGLSVGLSGVNASDFILTQPVSSTLDQAGSSTSFSIQAKENLAAGSYTATVTVQADSMADVSFEVTQQIDPSTSRPSRRSSIDETKGFISVSLDADLLNQAFNDAPEALSPEKTDQHIEIENEYAFVRLPRNMLNGTDWEGVDHVSIQMGEADKSGLPESLQDKIGNKPLLELRFMVENRVVAWSNPAAPITVSIPYEPTEAELANPEHLAIWYIDGQNNIVEMAGRYDPSIGAVSFTTTHFSVFAVSYVQKTYADLDIATWAKKPIEVLASKGIIRGKSESMYDPQGKITRADFLYLLVKALGATARTEENFVDIESDVYYYNEIAIAKKLGITTGMGNNEFDPEAQISRQDMMVLAERTLRVLQKMDGQGSASDLDKFYDKPLIAEYATGSVTALVQEGFIVGSDNRINPLENATRAEAAVFLYKIYNK